MDQHYLHPLFDPQAVVVFAGDEAAEPAPASGPGAVLREALCAQRFAGTLGFVGTDTRGTLADLAQVRADLAVIALPADQVNGALELAGRMACRAALVVTQGIDAAQAAELRRVAQREGLLLLGPNSAGLQRPRLAFNASPATALAADGPLALVSQSGALTAAILDWARAGRVGFSAVATVGPGSALDVADLLDFLAGDPHTQSIIVHLEGIGDARRFMSALRSAANAKPVVVLKAGHRRQANRAAQTHCGAIVGSDEVFDAALRRAGAVRVRAFNDLFSAAKCLAARYRPAGRRLALVTNGGGPGVLAADWAQQIGLEVGHLGAEPARLLRPRLPAQARLDDLVDLSADAGGEHYQAALEVAAKDPQVDGVLCLYAPRGAADAEAVARAVIAGKATFGKPLLACWMGDESVTRARALLDDAGIAHFRTPEGAVGAFGNIAAFHQNQLLLQQTPPPQSTLAEPDLEGARLVIESVLAERRNRLTELESKALLSAFHIPVTQTMLARSPNEAMMIATQLGYPVAMKIDSPDVLHKSDVQGVALNVQSGASARDTFVEIVERVKRLQPGARIDGVTVQRMARTRRAREICIGLVTDELFGPVLVFGAGGTMIELIADRAMELPPLNQYLARQMIERARVAETLGEWHGASPADLGVLEQVLLRVSEMVCEFPQLREMDINPILVDEDGAVAVDARIVVDGRPAVPSGRGPEYPHLAILPFPARYEREWPMRGGGEYLVRPIHPDDAQMLQRLVRSMSPESRYFRFISSLSELPPAMLARFTLIDYDREMALVAVVTEHGTDSDGNLVVDTQRIVGVSRYVTNPDHTSAEFALAVADDHTGRGIGSRLMESIVDVARERGLAELVGLVLARNDGMLKLMRRLGFTVKPYADDAEFRLVTKAL